MTKQEFFESFYKEYPYSCITIKDLQNIIEMYPEDTMPFRIESEWSWRGIYEHACLSISTTVSFKENNLKGLADLLKYTFTGYKGGEFRYEESTLIHFEKSYDEATTFNEDSCYFVQFIKNNEDNPFIQHLLNYFAENKHEDVEYYKDVLYHDLVEGHKVVYYNDVLEQLSIGYIFCINKEEHFCTIVDTPIYNVNENTLKRNITFNKIAQVNDL